MADEIRIEITEGGLIKTETDQISGANHQNAEQFLQDIRKLAGGKVQVKHRHKGAMHAHKHVHGDHHHEH